MFADYYKSGKYGGSSIKYYPDTTFMEAKLGSSPSFIWRSVLEAKEVISAG